MNAAEAMLILRDQVGLPLAATIDLDLQTIHDLLTVNIDPSDTSELERIVIVDDDTLEMLDRVVTDAIATARPDRRDFSSYKNWTSRSIALERFGDKFAHSSLAELDREHLRTTGVDQIALQDSDYSKVFALMNAAISARPHGRTRDLNGGRGAGKTAALSSARAFTVANRGIIHVPMRDGYHADSLAKEPASRFAVATMILMEAEFAPTVRANPRPVMFTFAQRGHSASLARIASNEGKDIICLEFDPGSEQEGPVNFAVFEKRNGKLNTWLKCDPWSPPDSGDLVLRARAGDFCFAYNGREIVLYHGRPASNHMMPGVIKALKTIYAVATSNPPDIDE